MKVGGFTHGLAVVAAIVAGCSRRAGPALPADSGLEAQAAVLAVDASDADTPDAPLVGVGEEGGALQEPPDASRGVLVRRAGNLEVASVVVRSGDGAGARGVFTSARPRLRACYERALAVDASVRGDMMLSVGVRDDGTVGDVAVGRSPLPPGTTGCFTRTIGSLRFPPSAGGSRVDARLLLTPWR